PGVRPRRQWLVSGLSTTAALSLPVLLVAGGHPQVQAAAWVVMAAGLAGLVVDAVALPRLAQGVLAGGVAVLATASGLVMVEVKLPFARHMVALGAWSAPVSVVWLLAIVYAVVLCRRLPGLTAGLVAIVGVTLGLAALLVGPSRSAPAAGLLGLVLAAVAAGASRGG
ncbi:MAG: hypothetical protein QHJ81_16585, partial [Anaerolineae bacterium]|nr:hypothetical protein [Anaerolineae bacterium]